MKSDPRHFHFDVRLLDSYKPIYQWCLCMLGRPGASSSSRLLSGNEATSAWSPSERGTPESVPVSQLSAAGPPSPVPGPVAALYRSDCAIARRDLHLRPGCAAVGPGHPAVMCCGNARTAEADGSPQSPPIS